MKTLIWSLIFLLDGDHGRRSTLLGLLVAAATVAVVAFVLAPHLIAVGPRP